MMAASEAGRSYGNAVLGRTAAKVAERAHLGRNRLHDPRETAVDGGHQRGATGLGVALGVTHLRRRARHRAQIPHRERNGLIDPRRTAVGRGHDGDAGLALADDAGLAGADRNAVLRRRARDAVEARHADRNSLIDPAGAAVGRGDDIAGRVLGGNPDGEAMRRRRARDRGEAPSRKRIRLLHTQSAHPGPCRRGRARSHESGQGQRHANREPEGDAAEHHPEMAVSPPTERAEIVATASMLVVCHGQSLHPNLGRSRS